ncbi:hypothetical protein K488DRAFT_69664 [Vararia minispora EC-137]|uniref:Uncharacterized protein n=1 Tax=Vararia minispora EC-137 TaxID=1314806 RepID=A0ACB8QQ74_9AGAM|nr:hypothetical protein K488DRAFT_69664 [Vararia minispora EC-137]
MYSIAMHFVLCRLGSANGTGNGAARAMRRRGSAVAKRDVRIVRAYLGWVTGAKGQLSNRLGRPRNSPPHASDKCAGCELRVRGKANNVLHARGGTKTYFDEQASAVHTLSYCISCGAGQRVAGTDASRLLLHGSTPTVVASLGTAYGRDVSAPQEVKSAEKADGSNGDASWEARKGEALIRIAHTHDKGGYKTPPTRVSRKISRGPCFLGVVGEEKDLDLTDRDMPRAARGCLEAVPGFETKHGGDNFLMDSWALVPVVLDGWRLDEMDRNTQRGL